jgi:hypothetical protein
MIVLLVIAVPLRRLQLLRLFQVEAVAEVLLVEVGAKVK